jgi:uncharacterized protein (TIGR02722 family)
MYKLMLWGIIGMSLVGLVSCGGKQVSRVGTETVTDLSGRWNDTDSRLVAEEMINDALNRPWVDNFQKKAGKEPTVIVGQVVNRSHEHINVQTFIKDLQRGLTNSGKVSFVAGKDEREDIRTERLDQAKNSAEETVKGPGKEAGADYMVIGTINTILDEEDGVKAMFYQVDLEMVDMANNKKVWLGQKKIKKIISKSRVKF